MKQLMYILFALYTPFLFAQENQTKTCTIEGKVIDQETGEPILFGDVALYKKGILITGTQTNLNGKYRMELLDPGTYDVEASYIGYKPQKFTKVNINASDTLRLDFALSQVVNLEEVVIVDCKKPLIEIDNTSSGSTMSLKDRQNMPIKNINALSSRTAGVSTSKKNNAKSSRSSRSSGTDYYLDGRRVTGQVTAESTRVTTKPDLSRKLTATEVNDFSDWGFWSMIQETDFIHTSISRKMNPSDRYSVLVSNNSGFPIPDVEVQLIDQHENILWTTVSDNLGKAELFANFQSREIEETATKIRLVDKGKIIDETEVKRFNGDVHTIQIDRPCQQREGIEMAFMMDVSGSMSDEMAYLRSEIMSITNRIKNEFPYQTLKVGVIYFQGHGDSNPISAHPLTEDIEALEAFIHGQHGGGGNDEAIDLALQTMTEFQWSNNTNKIAFLMGDEELNQIEENWQRQRDYTQKAAEKGIKLVPIGCSGMPKSLEYVMRAMAIASSGTYLALTDHSGIGGSHIKPTTNAIDVKSLNDLIFDVISRFSHAVDCSDPSGSPLALDLIAPDINLNKKYGHAAKDKSISIFPNPVVKQFSIKTKDKKDITEAVVCDLAGRIVKSIDLTQDEFDISNLANGQYYILYQLKNKSFGSSSIIKIGDEGLTASVR